MTLKPVLARDRKARSWKSLSHACLMTSQLAPKMILEVSWGPPGLLDWSGNDSTYLFVSRALHVFGYLFEGEKYTKNNSPTGPKLVPKSSLNGSKHLPNWLPNWSWNPLGGLLAMVLFRGPLFSPPVGLLERSWTPPGPKKTNWKRLLDGPRPPRRPVSACLGAKYPPKREPGRDPKIGPKRDPGLKRQNLDF